MQHKHKHIQQKDDRLKRIFVLLIESDILVTIQTGLHLLTRNTIDDEPIPDDEMSLNSEDKRAKHKV